MEEYADNVLYASEPVVTLLQEMRSAYDQAARYDYMNSDYAEYAAMAVSRFRKLLGCEHLTSEDLAIVLRMSLNEYRLNGEPDDWSGFVAQHLSQLSRLN